MFKSIESIRKNVKDIHSFTVWVDWFKDAFLEAELKRRGIRFTKTVEFTDDWRMASGYSFTMRETVYDDMLKGIQDTVIYTTKHGTLIHK